MLFPLEHADLVKEKLCKILLVILRDLRKKKQGKLDMGFLISSGSIWMCKGLVEKFPTTTKNDRFKTCVYEG